MLLDDFQKHDLLRFYDNPHVTYTAIWSMAKKNGKTALIAAIGLAHIVGPEARRNSQVVSGAMARDQAALVYKLMAKMVRMNPKLAVRVRLVDSRKEMWGLPMNVEFRALSADAKRTQGISPVLAILDEIGQVNGPQSEFVDAILTAQGAHEDAMAFVISTQAADDADLLSIMIDDALTGEDVHTVCRIYQADKDCDVMDEAQWKKANPALGTFRSHSDLKKLAEKASRIPSFGNTFRNLNLNQRVQTHSPFCTKDLWKIGSRDLVPYDGVSPVFAALDLAAVSDLTALTWMWWAGNQWNVGCRFWTPLQGLKERSKRDKTDYSLWVEQNKLIATPGPVIDYDVVAEDFITMAAEWNLQKVAFDAWRIEQFKSAVFRRGEARGENVKPLLEKMEKFAQYYSTMSPALDALEKQLLKEQIAHAGHPVLGMCAANAVVIKGAGAGERMLDKRSSLRRIDGMVALTMCAGIAAKAMEGVDTQPEHQVFFLGAA